MAAGGGEIAKKNPVSLWLWIEIFLNTFDWFDCSDVFSSTVCDISVEVTVFAK